MQGRFWLTVAAGMLTAGLAQAQDAAMIAKGKQLFEDPKLSASGTTSCATCHPGNGHTDNKTYVGLNVVPDGQADGRSTPTMWGAGTRSVYAWAGTAPKLEGNIKGIIVNRMKGAEPSPETLAALVAYVSSLKPPMGGQVAEDGAPADKASVAVKRGFELFTGDGECGTCHVLPTLDKAETEDVELGGKFKVPALWAVSKTGPYFHDGRTKDLSEAVKMMWEAQKKKSGKPGSPTAAQVADLVAYLNAL